MNFKISVYLLLIASFIYENYSYTIQEVIKESLEKGLNSLTQLRRQLPDDLDDDVSNDSRELMGTAEKEDLARYELSNTELIHPVHPPVDLNLKVNFSMKNCTCNFHKHLSLAPNSHGYNGSTSDSQNSNDTLANTTINEITTTAIPEALPTTHKSVKDLVLNETHFELRELEFQLDAAMKDVCPHYIDIPDLDIDNMADVWQLAYYKAQDPLLCFKILLQHTTAQSRKRLKQKYTTFNDTITWHECILELVSTGKTRDRSRRHFLQGSKSDNGVLENIVLSESFENGSKIITLQDQTPDQWMVTKNLLLMRDCDTGDVIIFSRVTSNPDRKDFIDAMHAFGENGMNDTEPCKTVATNKNTDRMYNIRNGNYNILS